MNLNLDASLLSGYHSGTQIARVLTEAWVRENMFCPRCGNTRIEHFANNRPVADFFCPSCGNEYELKSKNGKLGRKANDGAYDTMIQRITGNRNPDFLFLCYSRAALRVTDLLFVPKHFFVPDMIEKRRPLPDSARRAGWTGCNILLDRIPEQGRVEIISNGTVHETHAVVAKINRGKALETCDIDARGWLMDILRYVNSTPEKRFSLSELYAFEEQLYNKHPMNHNIRPKIRQQLQVLRDLGFIRFLGNGQYEKR